MTTAHAKISPSSAHRTIPCPGSIALIATLPPQPSSTAANEGSAAHELLATCITENKDPNEFLGESITIEDEKFTVTEAMVEGVMLALDEIDKYLDEGFSVRVEQRVSLEHLCKGQFGTADVILTHPTRGAVIIIDFKYGRVVNVPIQGNPQLLCYLSGVVFKLPFQAREMTITIIQPRTGGDPVKSVPVTMEELREHERAFAASAKVALKPDAPRHAGDHCDWCPAAGICPEFKELGRKAMLEEFGIEDPTVVPQRVVELTPDQVGKILDQAALIEFWIEAVRSAALHAAVKTSVMPTGYKLVAKRTLRKWIDDDKAAAALRMVYEREDEEIYTKKIISPAQAEKLLGKNAKKGLEPLWRHPPGDPTLAPMSDKREPLKVPASVDFKELFEKSAEAAE